MQILMCQHVFVWQTWALQRHPHWAHLHPQQQCMDYVCVRSEAGVWCRLVEGWDVYIIIQAAQKKSLKLRRGGDRLLELKAWVWHFSMHLAYALAQVCTSMRHSERQMLLQGTYGTQVFAVTWCKQ